MEKPFRFLVNDIVILKHSRNYYKDSVCTGNDTPDIKENIGGYYFIADCYYNRQDKDNNNEWWDYYFIAPLPMINEKRCQIRCNGKCLEFVEDQERYKKILRDLIIGGFVRR